MQTTSALYKSIVAGEHYFETKITLNGNEVTEDKIISLKREILGMSGNAPTVGGAVCSILHLTIINPSYTIPTRAEIKVYVRARNDTQTSEWIQSDTYYIDTRQRNASYNDVETIEFTAFDSMIKTEADYPDTSHSWPYLDKNVVAEIAQTIGVEVDSRTNGNLTAGYMVELPTGYVMREVLEHIAAVNCGNFVITAENKLLFVPLIGLDPEQNLVGRYLKSETTTEALTFGNEGWYILV